MRVGVILGSIVSWLVTVSSSTSWAAKDHLISAISGAASVFPVISRMRLLKLLTRAQGSPSLGSANISLLSLSLTTALNNSDTYETTEKPTDIFFYSD